MPKYVYEGPVMEFEKLLTEMWRAETLAPTERKAMSNLQYQFKKKNNKMPNSKIALPGKLQMIG